MESQLAKNIRFVYGLSILLIVCLPLCQVHDILINIAL